MADILWFCPVYKGARISQTFDQHPYFGKGVDFAIVNGTNVKTMRGGRVSQVVDKYKVGQTDGDLGYGNQVVIDHGKINGANYLSRYAHLYPGIPVAVGDLVSTGQVIAKSNNNGSSTGPHLHAEARRNNTPFDWWLYVVYTVEEVEGGIVVVDFTAPEYPKQIKGKIASGIRLNIRQRSTTTSKIVGSLYEGNVFNVIEGAWIGSDYWLHIGYDQYCAAYYQSEIYVSFVEETATGLAGELFRIGEPIPSVLLGVPLRVVG